MRDLSTHYGVMVFEPAERGGGSVRYPFLKELGFGNLSVIEIHAGALENAIYGSLKLLIKR